VKVREPFPSREIEHFGSQGFTHTRFAVGHVQVSKAELDGIIGGHEAASRQGRRVAGRGMARNAFS
jgi:hypothetical protein